MLRIADHIVSATPVSEGSHLYKALRSDGRTSAVQVFPFAMTAEQYGDFTQQVNLLAEVASRYHINIPAIMNWGYTQSGDFAFIEREWIEGHDLRLSHGDKRITVDEVGTIAEQMSKVLTHCHNVGIVHGKINGQHILWDTKREQYCLTGFRFGFQISKPPSGSMNNGSLQESLKQKDVYDLGLVLFQLVRDHLLTADVSNLSQLNNSLTNEKLKDGNVLPAWLITCINRAMSRGEEKFRSAHEMYSYVILHHKTPMPANKWYRSKPQQPLKARETPVVNKAGTTRKKLRSVLNSGVERGRQEMRFVFDRRIAAGLVIAGLLAGFSIIAQNRENKRNHLLAPRVIANSPQEDTTVVEQPAQNTTSVVEEKKIVRPKKRDKKIEVVQKGASDSTTDNKGATTNTGAYKVRSKAYFHNEPDETTKRNAFIVHWNNAILHPLKEENDFVYVVFTNHEGQTSKGWLRKKDLVKL